MQNAVIEIVGIIRENLLEFLRYQRAVRMACKEVVPEITLEVLEPL